MLSNGCLYYRIFIEKQNVIYFISLIRSMEDSMCFERIENKSSNIFEFFVPIGMNKKFLEIINILEKENLCSDLKLIDIIKSSLNIYE